jgi:hypothetical protein
MMAAELFVFGNVIDNDRPAAVTNFVAEVVLTPNSPPGSRPKAISSRTAQAAERSCVTRATAANPVLVVGQITLRMDATASTWDTAEMSAVRAASSGERPRRFRGQASILFDNIVEIDPSLSILADF